MNSMLSYDIILPIASNETISYLLQMALQPGDIVMELATRIDTATIWKEVKVSANQLV